MQLTSSVNQALNCMTRMRTSSRKNNSSCKWRTPWVMAIWLWMSMGTSSSILTLLITIKKCNSIGGGNSHPSVLSSITKVFLPLTISLKEMELWGQMIWELWKVSTKAEARHIRAPAPDLPIWGKAWFHQTQAEADLANSSIETSNTINSAAAQPSITSMGKLRRKTRQPAITTDKA